MRCSTAGRWPRTPTTTTCISATGRSTDTARHRAARPQPPQHRSLQRRQRNSRHAQRRAGQGHPQRAGGGLSTQYDPTRPVTQALFRPNAQPRLRRRPGRPAGRDRRRTTAKTRLLAAHAAQAHAQDRRHRESRTTAAPGWRCATTRRTPASSCGAASITWANRASGRGGIAGSGLLDRTGAIKPVGYERQSWWSEKPMVHMARRVAARQAAPDRSRL